MNQLLPKTLITHSLSVKGRQNVFNFFLNSTSAKFLKPKDQGSDSIGFLHSSRVSNRVESKQLNRVESAIESSRENSIESSQKSSRVKNRVESGKKCRVEPRNESSRAC